MRYEREEVGFFMIFRGGRGPEILAASTPFLRCADRVPLDLLVVAIFSMTSVSLALSILHVVKPVRTPVAILGSLGVCIYVPASRHWLISYSPIHLD